MSISGYNYPVDMGNYDSNIFAHHQYSAWGVAKWNHKTKIIDSSYAKIILKSYSKMIKILSVEPKIICVLMSMIAHNDRWPVFIAVCLEERRVALVWRT